MPSQTTKKTEDRVANAIASVATNLTSGAEQDQDGDEANVVDGLFAIARALEKVAEAIEAKAPAAA